MIYKNFHRYIKTSIQIATISFLTSCGLGSDDVWTDLPVPVSSFKTLEIDYALNGDVIGYTKNTYHKRTGKFESTVNYTSPGADGDWMTPDDFGWGSYYVYDDQDRLSRGLQTANPGADGEWLTADDQVDPSGSVFLASYEGDTDKLFGYTILPNNPGGDGAWFSSDDPIMGYQREIDDPVVPNQKLIVIYLDPGADTDWYTPDDVPSYYQRDLFDIFGNLLSSSILDDIGGDGIWFNINDRSLLENYYFTFQYDALNRVKYYAITDVGIDAVPGTADDVISSVDEVQYLPNGKEYRAISYLGAGGDTDWFTPDDVAFSYTQYAYDSQEKLIRADWYLDGGDGVVPSGDDVLDQYSLLIYDTNDLQIRTQHFDNNDILIREEIYEYNYKEGVTIATEKPKLF